MKYLKEKLFEKDKEKPAPIPKLLNNTYNHNINAVICYDNNADIVKQMGGEERHASLRETIGENKINIQILNERDKDVRSRRNDARGYHEQLIIFVVSPYTSNTYTDKMDLKQDLEDIKNRSNDAIIKVVCNNIVPENQLTVSKVFEEASPDFKDKAGKPIKIDFIDFNSNDPRKLIMNAAKDHIEAKHPDKKFERELLRRDKKPEGPLSQNAIDEQNQIVNQPIKQKNNTNDTGPDYRTRLNRNRLDSDSRSGEGRY
jgi:hypothetical protein